MGPCKASWQPPLSWLLPLAAAGSLTTCSRADAGACTNYPFLTLKERDNETGLDYFLARYYSSTSGRFTSPDPIFISDKQTYNPQLWNLYNYVGNNPLNGTDPTGMKLIRLGQHTDEWIDNRTGEINQQLNDPKSKLRDSQRAALRDELDTIGHEKQGNAVAREAIRQLNAIGEGANLKVSDFTPLMLNKAVSYGNLGRMPSKTRTIMWGSR